jgi:ABC-type branched-subunit amino acid transport system substrate-binding protein
MGRKKLFIIVSAIALILLFAFLPIMAGCGGTTPETPTQTLRIGSLLCLTGWWSVDDVLQEKELTATAQYINDQGGITIDGQTYTIELVTEDGQSTMDGVAAAARKLVDDDNVQFIAGPTALWPFGSSPVFSQADVMDVVSFAGNSPGNMDASTPNTFLAGSGTLGSMEVAIAVLQKYYPDAQSAVVMRPDDGNTEYIEPALKTALANAGITWAGFVTYSNTTTDFSPTATQLHSIDADAIIHIDSNAPMIASIVKDLRGMGDERPYITGVICPLSDVIQIAGMDICHDVSTAGAAMDVTGNPPQLDAVIKILTDQNNGTTPSLVLMNANALYALVSVIQAANSLDPSAVRDQWVSMTTIDTLYGPGVVSGTETFGIADHALTMPSPYQIVQNGQVVSGWVNIPTIP